MRDIIEELYSGEYEPKVRFSKAYLARLAEDDPLWRKVLDAFGSEFQDRLWEGISMRTNEECRTMFRHGFHLGALLMLDLLYDAPGSAS